jgi:hypothetical protein
MKASLFSVLVSLISVVILNHAQAQSNDSDKQAMAMVKEFYTN